MKRFGQFWSIFTAELSSYFNSPIAYIFIVVFVTLTGGLYMSNFFLIGNADMRYFFDLLPVILCVFIPAITMRLWAEERKGNTFELLLTFPMGSYKIVLGKFTAAVVFYVISLAGTVFIPVMLFLAGKPDPGPIIGGYIGAAWIGAFFLSVGIFISGMCKDQIIAFIITLLACLFFFLTGQDFIAGLIDGWLPGVGSFIQANFGMTSHFASFNKGVIDNKDVLYFLIMTASFIILNIFFIEDRMKPKAKIIFSLTVLVCLAGCVMFNALVADVPLGRFDLTEGKIYTITDSTKSILKRLKSPVSVKLYISPADKMPTSFKTLEQQIKDQLEELSVIAKGKLKIETFHMETAQNSAQTEEEPLEQSLQRKGISPFQVRSIDKDEMQIKLIYSAISISYKEKEEQIINRIVPQTLYNLEYDLMSKIFRMTLDNSFKVALLAPYSEKPIEPEMQELLRKIGKPQSQYWEDRYSLLESALKYEDYEVSRIKLTEESTLPEDTDTLIIVAPEKLNDRQRHEINRFLYEGGHVLISAQKYKYNYRQAQQGIAVTPIRQDLGINELISNYGVSINENILMDKNNEVVNIPRKGFGPFSLSVPVKLPMHIRVDQATMAQDLSITGRLSFLFYMWGSALDVNNDVLTKNNLLLTTLMTSSPESWTVEHRHGTLNPDNVAPLSGYEGPFPLAVLIEGRFPDVFKGKAPPEWPVENEDELLNGPGDEEEPEQAPPDGEIPVLESKPGKLIVIGCSKMFEAGVIKQGGALNFFINSVDALTLGKELISIRSRQPINRRIKTLNKVEKLWYRFLTVVLVPLVVISAGGIRAFLIKKEKERYMSRLKSNQESKQ